jgi:hypothetical protein
MKQRVIDSVVVIDWRQATTRADDACAENGPPCVQDEKGNPGNKPGETVELGCEQPGLGSSASGTAALGRVVIDLCGDGS